MGNEWNVASRSVVDHTGNTVGTMTLLAQDLENSKRSGENKETVSGKKAEEEYARVRKLVVHIEFAKELTMAGLYAAAFQIILALAEYGNTEIGFVTDEQGHNVLDEQSYFTLLNVVWDVSKVSVPAFVNSISPELMDTAPVGQQNALVENIFPTAHGKYSAKDKADEEQVYEDPEVTMLAMKQFNHGQFFKLVSFCIVAENSDENPLAVSFGKALFDLLPDGMGTYRQADYLEQAALIQKYGVNNVPPSEKQFKTFRSMSDYRRFINHKNQTKLPL